MEPDPSQFNGAAVVKFDRITPDMSEVPNLGVALLLHAGTYSITDMFCRDGEPWEAQNYIHDITDVHRATNRFVARVFEKGKLFELAVKRHLTWADVANIRWSHTPVSGRDEFNVYGREVAGFARNFGEFYKAENREIQRAVEEWLTRYSAAHTSPDLR